MPKLLEIEAPSDVKNNNSSFFFLGFKKEKKKKEILSLKVLTIPYNNEKMTSTPTKTTVCSEEYAIYTDTKYVFCSTSA